MIEGIDAAWSRPTPKQMIAAGKHFIVGYVSHDPSKNLTKHECEAYLAAGIEVGLVWETTARRALDGRTAGATDGAEARRQATALGFPSHRPIYTAVDFDATHAQLVNDVGPYLSGFAARVGGVGLAGVYGGIATVAYALDHHLVGYGWQTYAWSSGRWDPRAQLQQYRNGVPIAGHDTDLDRATTADYGQWNYQGDDMTYPTTSQIEHAVWHTPGSTGTPGVSAGADLASTTRDSAAGLAQSKDNSDKLDQILAAIEELPAKVVAALPPHVTGNLTTEDLEAIGGVMHDELGKISIALAD